MQPIDVRTIHHFRWYERIGSLEKLRAESKVIQLLWKDFKDLQFVIDHTPEWKRKLFHSYNAVLYELDRFDAMCYLPGKLFFNNYSALYRLVLCLVRDQLETVLYSKQQLNSQVPEALSVVLESSKIWLEYNVGCYDYENRVKHYTNQLVIPHLNQIVFVKFKNLSVVGKTNLSQRSTYCPFCVRNCAIFGAGTGRETVKVVCSHCEKSNLHSLKHPNLLYLIAKLKALTQTNESIQRRKEAVASGSSHVVDS